MAIDEGTVPGEADVEFATGRTLVRPYIDEYEYSDDGPELSVEEISTAEPLEPASPGARHARVRGVVRSHRGRGCRIPLLSRARRAGGRSAALFAAGGAVLIIVGAVVLTAGIGGGAPGSPGAAGGPATRGVTRPGDSTQAGDPTRPGGSTQAGGTASAGGATSPGDPTRAGDPRVALPAPGPGSTGGTGAPPGAPAPSVTDLTGSPPGTPVAQPSPLLPPPTADLTGRITNVAGVCLSAVTVGSDRVRLWDCDGTGNQVWTLAADGTLRTSGLCAQPSAGMVRLVGCDGNAAQQWRMGPARSLVNAASAYCLGDPLAGATKGTLERIAPCDQSGPQQWILPGPG
jgi:hypothetical protein